MPVYLDVVTATTETATKILARRSSNYRVATTTDGGRTASVSWSKATGTVKLNMPALPPDTALTRTEADRLTAYVIHECCHVLHTDWMGWERAVGDGARVRGWTNALEDVRIEAREIRAGHFPAMRALLASLCMSKHFEALGQAKAHGFTIGQRVSDAPYVVTILGRLANKYAIPTAIGLAKAQSPDVRRLTDHALAGVKRCRDTWDVLALARELVAMEQAMAPPPPPPQPPPQDDEPQDGSDAPQDGQDGQDSQDGSDGSDTPQDDQDDQDGQDGHTGASAKADDDDDGAPAIDPDRQLDDMVRDIAKRAGIDDVLENAKEDRSHRLNTVRSTITGVDTTTTHTGLRQFASAQLDKALPGSSVLHGQIARLLVSEELRGRTHHEMSGRLDRRALVRMKTGAPDVYSRRDDEPGVDTALLILIDGSSSMQIGVTGNLNRLDTARVTAWHIAKAAEMAGAKLAIGAFYTRVTKGDGAQILVVKPWDMPCADCAYSLTRLQADNFTPLSAAIIAGAGMLEDVPATRHIMLVLTDGECDLGAQAVTAACRITAAMGVETVGIGMDCASVAAAFPPRYSVNVTDLAQLATKGLGVLVDMLEDAAPRRAGAD